MKIALSLLISILLSSGATAQTALEPPPPSTVSDAAVKDWLAHYIRTDRWTIITADSVAVSFGGPDGVAVLESGLLKATVRHEYYRPTEIGDFSTRSNSQTWIIDCEHHRHKVIQMEIYALSNLMGEHKGFGPRRLEQVEWAASESDSPAARVETRICESPTTGKPLG